MSIERARAWLTARGVDPARILEFPVSSATVELAAKALNCAPERIAKSLALRLLGAAGDGVLLVVAAGDARLDNAKYKARFGCKPKRRRLTADFDSHIIVTSSKPARYPRRFSRSRRTERGRNADGSTRRG